MGKGCKNQNFYYWNYNAEPEFPKGVGIEEPYMGGQRLNANTTEHNNNNLH